MTEYLAVCAMIDCENGVPKHEWPRDRNLPKICDPCLRKMQSRPSLSVEALGRGPQVSDDDGFTQLVSS